MPSLNAMHTLFHCVCVSAHAHAGMCVCLWNTLSIGHWINHMSLSALILSSLKWGKYLIISQNYRVDELIIKALWKYYQCKLTLSILIHCMCFYKPNTFKKERKVTFSDFLIVLKRFQKVCHLISSRSSGGSVIFKDKTKYVLRNK